MWKSWLKLYVYVYSTPSNEALTRLQFLLLSKGHGIEGAFLLGGKVIDQDHGLAAVYTTLGAEGVSTSSLQSSTILTNLNCSFSVNAAKLIAMKSLPVSRHMYSEYLIYSWVPSADLFSSNEASLDEVTEAFGDGDQETGGSGAKRPAAQPLSTALAVKIPVTPKSLEQFLEDAENEHDDHHLVKKTLVFVLGEQIIF